MSLDSVPTQPTSSRRIESVPWPKKALVRAIAPIIYYDIMIPAQVELMIN